MPVLEALNYQYRCRYGRHSLEFNTTLHLNTLHYFDLAIWLSWLSMNSYLVICGYRYKLNTPYYFDLAIYLVILVTMVINIFTCTTLKISWLSIDSYLVIISKLNT